MGESSNATSVENYAELHVYTPLIIDGDKSTEQLKVLAENSTYGVSSYFKHSSRHLNEVASSLSAISHNVEGSFSGEREEDVSAESYSLELGQRDDFLTIKLVSETAGRMNQISESMLEEEAEFNRLYGAAAHLHTRVLLVPTEGVLSNGQQITIANQLLLFPSGICIIKQEIPILGYGNTELTSMKAEDYIARCWNVVEGKVQGKSESIVECRNALAERLLNIWDANGIVHNHISLSHFILTEYNGRPERFPFVDEKLEIDVLRTVWSPVPRMNLEAERELISELKEKYASHFPGVCSYYSKTGGVLSLIDNSTFRKGLSNIDRNEINLGTLSNFTRMINYSFDLAFIVSAIDRAVDEQLFEVEMHGFVELPEAIEAYRRGRLICEQIQIGGYGSVADQIKRFKEKMPHYFQADVVRRRKETLDALLQDEERSNKDDARRLLERVSLVITVFVSLPSLSEGMFIFGELAERIFQLGIDMTVYKAAGVFIWGLLCVYVGRNWW